MYILAFETSCDDTSVALLQDDQVLALSTRTQLEHSVTGGVVPEVAARSHANAIFPCLQEVLDHTNIPLRDIDILACTQTPGLVPSLLTGMTVAQTLSTTLKKPLLWIHHIEAHIFSNLLERTLDDIVFPGIVLTLSGGHTELYLWKSLGDLEYIGGTRDDAVGEAYDKVAKMLGFGFPGGAKIAALATQYRKECSQEEKKASFHLFPRAFLEPDSLDFSFSGIKSAVKRFIEKNRPLTPLKQQQIAFAFEEAVIEILITKLFLAATRYQVGSLFLAGGVSANTTLRERIQQKSQENGYVFLAPAQGIYSQDNAAMVGIRAYYEWNFLKK